MRELLWLMRSRYARGGATAIAPPPSLDSVSPTSGSSGGGTTITLRGNLLDGVTRVLVGGVDCTSVVRQGTRQCQAVTPAGAAGPATVQALTAGGAGVLTSGFTYIGAAPTVTNVSPGTGPTSGGTPITVTGTNFTGATSCTINGVPCTSLSVVGPTSLTCTTPAGSAGAQTCAVTTPSGTGSLGSAFTYVAAPTVTSVSKSIGDTAGGFSVDIGGTNFVSVTNVTVGGNNATSIVVNSSISITCTFPAGTAGAATVAVTALGGTGSNGALFTYFSPAQLTLTGWVRGSYSGSPWAGVASAGASGSRSFDAGTAPSAGTALNGYAPANFVAADSTYLRDATNADSTYLSSTGYRVLLLVNLTSAAVGPTAPIFNAAGLLTGDGGYWGIVYDDTGVHCYHFDGSYQVASSASAVATGGWHLVDVKYDGTDITVSVDGVAGTPVAASSLSAITSYLRVGTNYADAVFADAKIEEVIIADASLSATTAAMFKAYVNARYGLSL